MTENRPLTIWIPTFRRTDHLLDLLRNIKQRRLLDIAEVVVSDNDQLPPNPELTGVLNGGFRYRQNVSNLTAGANFLRSFEECTTPWIMIVGDDDLFHPSAVADINFQLHTQPEDVVAVKFDSSLFGSQPVCLAHGLMPYVKLLDPGHYPLALNNLCFVSNWMFRVDPCRRHLAAAYIGYSSKLSHVLPPLRACAEERTRLAFVQQVPVRHGQAESGWPKAATSYEMAMTLSTFSGFVDLENRIALRKLLFHADWRRISLKCLRVGPFYSQPSHGISPVAIHLHQALLSWRYALILTLLFPLLLLPTRLFPAKVRRLIGDCGSVERW